MLEIIRQLIKDVLLALYQPFLFSVIFAGLLVQVFLTAEEKGSVRAVLQQWKDAFVRRKAIRHLYVFFFYLTMILFRTLLNRELWANPLSDVIGPWGFYDRKGQLNVEWLENLALFVPFTFLLWMNFRSRICRKEFGLLLCLGKSAGISFLFSFGIEGLQLLLRLGTFQLSDLFFNTAGGLLGGMIYWIFCKAKCIAEQN